MITESQVFVKANRVLDFLGLCNTATMKDKDRVMKYLIPLTRGQVDSRTVDRVVNSVLGGR